MPSVGLKKKLSVLGVAVAALGVSTSSASASDVSLWACHGPSGEALGNTFGDSNFAGYGAGCTTAGGSLDGGGMRGSLVPADGKIAYGATASAFLKVPPGTQLKRLRMSRRATGLVAGTEYTATALGSALPGESSSGADLAGDARSFAIDPGSVVSGNVLLKLACVPTAGCPATGPAALDVSGLALTVTEAGDGAPTFAVGGTRSPAAGPDPIDLDIRANDPGIGLKGATAYFDGQDVPAETRFPSTNCEEITPGDSTIDLPLNNGCAHVEKVNIKLDPRSVPDGNYTLVVRVSDWAGNVTEQRSPVEINNNVNLGQASQTLSIGTSNSATPNASPNTNNGQGGVAGQSAQNCKTPRLSFSLSQKPMRVSKGVPVLQSAKRYRFTGRLTCVINGKRRSAPKRARIDIYNKIGKKTYEKSGVTVGDAGKLSVILSYKSSRTLIFRFTSADNKRSQVSIKIKVEKKKKSKR